ncbi:MAG: hypothetical protein ACK4K7_04640 [Allosphingosinicella sp.]|uniref:hypothetical protein n=1 Tax=Allosphingosinicella sp. TaxID=2823234 RepID=UPI003920DD9C
MTKTSVLALAAVGLLAACGETPTFNTAETAAAPLPEQACADVRKALGELSTRVGIVYENGEATIENTVWMQLGGAAQDQIVQALAVEAACGQDSPPREQRVLVRDETGRTITDRTVPVAADLSDLVGG